MSEQAADITIILRPARSGDGQALFDVTAQSIAHLGQGHYSRDQLAGWMGARTAAYYEDMIRTNQTVVAELAGEIVGFVDAVPGEVTRLFLLPKVAGRGLGRQLLDIGAANARADHSRPIRIESTLNARAFYEKCGFRAVETGYFSHGIGGDPIEIVVMEKA